MHRFRCYVLVIIGSICVMLGVLGIFVPVLPTTPFLVLAAALYARSSQRFYDWLMSRKHLGEYILAYREGHGMAAGAKALSISLLWLTLGSSAILVDTLHVRLLLVAVGVGVTTHLLWIPTYERIALIDKARALLAKHPYTLDLGRRGVLGSQRVGGKASSLLWLRREGFSVPTGFVVTPAALREHLVALNCDWATLDDLPLTHDMVLRIKESPLPQHVERDILRRYGQMDGPVAVRSSATCEDTSWTSCAGLLRTELNVQGDQAVLNAVRSCWASLFTEDVRSYLREHKEAATVQRVAPTMAVVVQRMVPAIAAGVAFTADPTSGARHLVIEAAHGLGARVVSGHVTPYRYLLEPSGAVIQSPRSAEAPLSATVLPQLAQLLWRIDETAGAPQDIEWAWDGDQIWMLQARPITTLQNKRIYSSRMAAEMSPGIIKPLVWSVNTSRIAVTFDRAFLELTGRHEPHCYQMMTLVHSRLYLDSDTFTALLGRLGMPPSLIRGILYGRVPGQHHRVPMSHKFLKRLPRTSRFMWRVTRAGKDIASFVLRHEQALELFRQADLTTHSPDALLTAVYTLMQTHADTQWYTKLAGLNLMIRNAALKHLARRWASDVDPADLLVGLSGVRSLQSGIRLRALSQIAAGLTEAERQLLLTGTDADIRTTLADTETGRDLLLHMEAYMAEFGFLNSNGTDFSRTPWIEQPAMIWRAIARGTEMTHGSAQTDQVLAHKQAQQRLVQRRGPVVRHILRRALASTRHSLLLKEQCSLLMSEDSYHMHRLAGQLARHLFDRGCLEDAEDVYCLSIEEINQALSGEMTPGQVRILAAQRRTQLEFDALIEPPEVIYGEWQPLSQAGSMDGQKELRGIGASPGQAHGRARVVLDPAAVPLDVSTADILIVPFTDVGWMPLFSGIGGLVTEHGGQLSHSAIVAREFGLPAVIGVDRATRLVRDGQRISIDGNRGIIYLVQ